MESNGGGGEVRRVNLVYFLSRSGHVDHPHLLRVHHLCRNGVFLRDVKRWLADARGDAMPNAFSWSCKRRYKNGYVWQDLLDDDLITPISDNEYVLKGSEILLTSSNEDTEKKPCARNVGDAKEKFEKPKLTSEMMMNHKEYPVFQRSSSATASTVTEEESITNEEETKQGGKNRDGSGNVTESGRPSVSSTTSSSSYVKSKSYTSARASNVLRSLMKCGGLDTNDAVLVPLNKSTSCGAFGVAWEDERRYQHQQHNARKSLEGAWSGIKMKETIEICKPNVASSMPCIAPLCSQCGKLFKPEKMHSHMKLCRGRKNPSASNNDSVKGNNSAKPRQQGCKKIPAYPLGHGHKRVVRTTLINE